MTNKFLITKFDFNKFVFIFQIVGVDKNDEGEYTCVADNGRRPFSEAKIRVRIFVLTKVLIYFTGIPRFLRF